MSVHYTDKISHLLAMDDMTRSSLLQLIRVWTNLIRLGCQDISLIWGAGNSLWQCGVLSGGFRAAECRCVKGANGQHVWLWLHIHKEAQRKVPNKPFTAIHWVVCDGNPIEFICPCILTFVHVSWNLAIIMSVEYLIRPYQAMKNFWRVSARLLNMACFLPVT